MFLEVWISLRLLLPGAESSVMEESYVQALQTRATLACAEWKAQQASGVELQWTSRPSTEALRKLESSTEGKQFYVLWLKDRYSYNIARLNEAYGLEAASFTDLAESDFRALDRRRAAVVADDALFAKVLEETILQKAASQIHACAPSAKLRSAATKE